MRARSARWRCAPGLFLPKRLALVVPLAILLLSDAVIDWHYGANFFGTYMVDAVRAAGGRSGLLGLVVAPGARKPRGWTAGAAGPPWLASTFFYVATNALTWLGSPQYPQNLGGLWQALTVGLPGYAPSYVFYRNGLVSDLLYSMVFMSPVSGCLCAREAPLVRMW